MILNEQGKYFWYGIPVLAIVGSAFHFLYALSGGMFAAGLAAPVNESVFEHMKLFPVPAALWYGFVYLLRRQRLTADLWFTAALLAIVTQVSAMALLYYFYTGAFGLESLAADILNFLVTVALGQTVGYCCYRSGRGMDRRLSVALLLVLLLAFAVLTVVPPRLPIFRDPVTGTYGIAANP